MRICLLTGWNVPLYQDIAFILSRDYVRDNVVIIADLCKVTQRDKHIRVVKHFLRLIRAVSR